MNNGKHFFGYSSEKKSVKLLRTGLVLRVRRMFLQKKMKI